MTNPGRHRCYPLSVERLKSNHVCLLWQEDRGKNPVYPYHRMVVETILKGCYWGVLVVVVVTAWIFMRILPYRLPSAKTLVADTRVAGELCSRY